MINIVASLREYLVFCLKVIGQFGFALCVLVSFLSGSAAAADDYKIGVYYYPGWRDHQVGAAYPEPWKKIQPYPEREPLLGWYDDGSVDVLNKQLGWMSSYGIDYVVFDWYWGGGNPLLGHSINAYLAAPNRSKVNFSLLWANHDNVPKSKEQFTLMVRYWIAKYFSMPEYLKIDGRPVVFIFSHDYFQKRAKSFGSSAAELLVLADNMARDAGLSGIYFVGDTHWEADFKKSGYSAISAYNYPGFEKESESFEELDSEYRKIWNKVGYSNSIPYFVPMTQGWDKRPWGGSKNPNHDNSVSTPDSFAKHISAAKKFMDSYPTQTLKTGVICCWNEYGEGSVIEPTKAQQFQYLEKVRSVFGSKIK